MDYLWWCSSATKSNKVSEPVFNCVPNIETVKPARLDESKNEVVKRCKAANWACKAKICGCCGIWAAFTDTNSYMPSDIVGGGAERVEEMKAEWMKTFEATTHQGAADSLPGPHAPRLLDSTTGLELVCVQTQNFHYTLEGKN